MKTIKKINLYIIAFAYAFSTFSQGILMPVYAFFVQKIGGGILETSWAIALFSMVTGIMMLFIFQTPWSKTYQKECLLGGWLLWLISLILYCCINTTTMLFISQILNGVGNAFSTPAYDAEYSEQAADNLGAGWGLYEGITSIFYGIAALMGGLIAASYGFLILFYWMIFFAALSFALIVYYVYIQKKLL